MKKAILLILLCICFSAVFAQKKSRRDYLITLKTNKGEAHIILYNEAPKHKANFIKLVKEHYYDSLLFHRVIENFIIQGGDPNSLNAKKGEALGTGGGELEKLPFEYSPIRIHKKGALAAATNGNKEKMSNPRQFYIVHGKKLADDELDKVEKNNQVKYTNQQRADYLALGGAPFLDNKYTVFGEIIDNLDLIDQIVSVQKDGVNRPEEDIKMAIKVRKYSKKRITRKYKYVFK